MVHNDEPSVKAGINLKHQIKKAGFTQEEFAHEFHVDVRSLRRWMKCGIKDINTITKIAEFFNVDVKTILK